MHLGLEDLYNSISYSAQLTKVLGKKEPFPNRCHPHRFTSKARSRPSTLGVKAPSWIEESAWGKKKKCTREESQSAFRKLQGKRKLSLPPISFPSCSPMKLTVKTLQGVAFSIDAESTDTVRRPLPFSRYACRCRARFSTVSVSLLCADENGSSRIFFPSVSVQ